MTSACRAAAVLVCAAVAAALLAVPAPAGAQDAPALCEPGAVEQFSDVADGDYAAAYILCARALELTQGTADGNFAPEGTLSRAQMAAFLARLWRDTLNQPCPTQPAHPFTDTAGNFAEADIACIYALGITKGTTATTFSPTADLNTAAVTRFTARLLNKNTPGTCDLTGDELAQAAACLQNRNIAPTTAEASAYDPTPRAQMAVYLIGAWHHATGRGQPPKPPAKPQPAAAATGYKAIAIGTSHLCALTTDSTITCWGDNSNGQADAPDGQYKAVTAASGYTCAVKVSGEAVCWGGYSDWTEWVEATAPEGKYDTISAGDRQACAIAASGEAVCWSGRGKAYAPSGEFIAVSAGGGHTCAITTNNEAVCWGDNSSGQANPPSGKFSAIAAGEYHTCAITTSSDAVCWGAYWDAAGDVVEATAPSGKFSAIAADWLNSCAITTGGDAVCWGSNFDELGGEDGEIVELAAPSGKLTAISMDSAELCALTDGGEAVCWGNNPSRAVDAPDGKFSAISVGSGFVCPHDWRRGGLLGQLRLP